MNLAQRTWHLPMTTLLLQLTTLLLLSTSHPETSPSRRTKDRRPRIRALHPTGPIEESVRRRRRVALRDDPGTQSDESPSDQSPADNSPADEACPAVG